MQRRKFFKTVSYGAAGALLLPQSGVQGAGSSAEQTVPLSPEREISVRVSGQVVRVETFTLSATIEKGVLTSLQSKLTGEQFIEKPDIRTFRALQLLYQNQEIIQVNEEKFGSVEAIQLSERHAEIRFHGWDGDGVIAISADPETGDLLVEPSAFSSRGGVLACRWLISGLKPSLELVAPIFQGVKLKLDDPLVKNSRWQWPYGWEAGLAILQSQDGGFWVHTRDTRYRFKALQTGIGSDPYALGFDSEAYGPVEQNLSAGGLCWRLNVYRGGWQVPAETYRKWYWQAYGLAAEEHKRQPWIFDLKLAVSWCPGRSEILDALAKRVSPHKVLLHFPNWRTDNYDENYPRYEASESGMAFISKCNQMGFHVAPHFNSIDMDPSHPVYSLVRDFEYRSVGSGQRQGWSWYNGSPIGVPESNGNLLHNRDKKVMVKIHPGLRLWRSILGENILQAAQACNLDTVFIDVTLCMWNLRNAIVESHSTTEGMDLLIKHVASLGKGLVVGGEGLNEITAQGQSFAQAHLFNSHHNSIAGLERAGNCNLNELLFGKLCRTIGYANLSGKDDNEALRMRIHAEHGAIPTLTIGSEQEILNPNPLVAKLLEVAAR